MLFKSLLVLASATINLLIPPQYQEVPDRPLTVIFVEPKALGFYCGKAQEGYSRLGCTRGGKIIVPNPCAYPEAKDPDSYARLLCHEKAHILGWRHKDD